MSVVLGEESNHISAENALARFVRKRLDAFFLDSKKMGLKTAGIGLYSYLAIGYFDYHLFRPLRSGVC
jgi:hypothetical protein